MPALEVLRKEVEESYFSCPNLLCELKDKPVHYVKKKQSNVDLRRCVCPEDKCSGPRALRKLFHKAGILERELDVACSDSSTFHGGNMGQQVRFKACTLFDMMEAACKGEAHWALDPKLGLQFYLAQSTIKSGRRERIPEPLSALQGAFQLPSSISEDNLIRMNLWAGAGETLTNAHYDTERNLLFVLSGVKLITLLPPNLSRHLKPRPAVSGLGANQSTVPSSHPVYHSKKVVRVTLRAGEALYIPDGLWHMVKSTAGTIAVNIWFCGIHLEHFAQWPRLSFYSRCLASAMTSCAILAEDKRRQRLKRWRPRQGEVLSLPRGAMEASAQVMTQEDMKREITPCSVKQNQKAFKRLLLSASPATATLLAAALDEEWDQNEAARIGVSSAFPNAFLERKRLLFARKVCFRMMHDALTPL
jgi:hypothetical protein